MAPLVLGGTVASHLFGASVGNALAPLLQMPIPLLTGIGFVAVFSGAANTPIASTLMAIKLFGSEIGMYAAIACVVSYLFSWHTGIYRSQRIGHAKHRRVPEGMKLSELPAYRKQQSQRTTSQHTKPHDQQID